VLNRFGKEVHVEEKRRHHFYAGGKSVRSRSQDSGTSNQPEQGTLWKKSLHARVDFPQCAGRGKNSPSRMRTPFWEKGLRPLRIAYVWRTVLGKASSVLGLKGLSIKGKGGGDSIPSWCAFRF